MDIRSPVLLRPGDPVQRGSFRAVVLEGVDMGVIVEHEITLESFTALQLACRLGRPCRRVKDGAGQGQLPARAGRRTLGPVATALMGPMTELVE